MYDRHRPIIKWYEYDASKLVKQVEAETIEPSVDVTAQVAPQEPVNTQSSTDPSLDDEVARIMAAFTGAKQDSVDSVFASMNSGEMSEEDLISSLCTPRQNGVDELVSTAKGM